MVDTSANAAGRNGAYARETFEILRDLDYCSVDQLAKQTGCDRPDWPAYAVHELFDNALDACEDNSIAPEIHLRVTEQYLEVSDNGPGIPTETIERLLDFRCRVSSREVYVSPCRGAQGNALKTLVMMPCVLHGREAVVEVTARGLRHTIHAWIDRIAQKPAFEHNVSPIPETEGTTVRLHWPQAAAEELVAAGPWMATLAENYSFFNPHLSLDIDCLGHKAQIARDGQAWKKWMPNQPPCAHWYQTEDVSKLVMACINKDRSRGRDRTVREFLTEFAGLTSTAIQSQILEATRMKRTKLSELIRDKEIDDERVGLLLNCMKERTKQLKPSDLGFIGKEHLRNRLAAVGCRLDTLRYERVPRKANQRMAIPWSSEAAFGWVPGRKERRLVLGVNWSPSILNPFRDFGHVAGDGIGGGLDGLLEELRISPDDPVVFVLHVASAHVRFTDPGKTALALSDDRNL